MTCIKKILYFTCKTCCCKHCWMIVSLSFVLLLLLRLLLQGRTSKTAFTQCLCLSHHVNYLSCCRSLCSCVYSVVVWIWTSSIAGFTSAPLSAIDYSWHRKEPSAAPVISPWSCFLYGYVWRQVIYIFYLFSYVFFINYCFPSVTGNNMGPLLGMVGRIDPSIIVTALISTAVVFMSFSASALLAARGSWLYLGGTLMTVLSSMLVFSLMNIFFQSYLLFQVFYCVTYISWVRPLFISI